MEIDCFAWVRQPGVIDADHPDYAELIEADEILRWQEAGAPPVEEWNAAGGSTGWPPAEPPPLPVAPTVVELPAVALAVSRAQAAALLQISVDTFERRVLPSLRVVQVGRRQLVPIRELETWMTSNSARALKG